LEPFYYWPDVSYGDAPPPDNQFAEVAHKIKSRFFTMDTAQDKDGKWWFVELGDGQAAGLTETTDVAAFYTSLQAALLR